MSITFLLQLKEIFSIMKKFCISFFLFAIIVLSGISLNASNQQVSKEYLRIHIRANSNEVIDQSVKYIVKEKVVEFLTPYIANCDTKKKAEEMLKSVLPSVISLTDSVLSERGYNYSSSANVRRESFPTRVYENLELPSGFYDALVIELGEGKGDNWWCVVYPPLCFTEGNAKNEYRSRIIDLINDFFEKEKKFR